MTRGGIVLVAALAACAGSPQPAARPSSEAQALFLAGDYRGAMAGFEREGGGASARLSVALCLIKLDRPRDAVAALQALAGSVQPPDVTLRIQLSLAEAHAMTGDATASLRAAQAAERAAERRPGSVARDEFLFVTGCAHLRMGRAEGRARLRELIELEPRSSLAAEAALRLQVTGFGVRVGDAVEPHAPPPVAGGISCRLVRVDTDGVTRIFALMDGLTTYQQAHTLAGKLRRTGVSVGVLP